MYLQGQRPAAIIFYAGRRNSFRNLDARLAVNTSLYARWQHPCCQRSRIKIPETVAPTPDLGYERKWALSHFFPQI